MEPFDPFGGQNHLSGGDMPRRSREAPETSAQAASKTDLEDPATDERELRKMETSDSDREGGKKRRKQVPSNLGDEGLETMLADRSQVEKIPAPDPLAGLQSMLGDPMDIRSPLEDRTQAGQFTELGVAAYERFERTGNIEDVDRAIEYWEIAAILLGDSQTNTSSLLGGLGCAYQHRFEHLGELSDLNKAIESQAQAVSLAPDGDLHNPVRLNNLGVTYHTRFERLGELSDLDKAIESQAQAVLLTPDGGPHKPVHLNNLGVAYRTRFERLGELSDLNKAIESQAQAVSLAPDGDLHNPVRLNNLGVTYHTRFERLGELSDLDKAIESQTRAVSLIPDDHPDKPGYLNALGVSYKAGFSRMGELSDLNKAIESHVQAVSLIPDDHPNKPGYLSSIGAAYQTRFDHLGELSDLNQAIECQALAVSLTPDNHPNKPNYLNNLGAAYKTRFMRLGDLVDLNKAIEFQTKAVSLTPDGHPNQPRYLSGLGIPYEARFRRLGELSDLNTAIECQERAVSLTPEGHPDKPGYLANLEVSYKTRFGRLDADVDMESRATSSNGKIGVLRSITIARTARFSNEPDADFVPLVECEGVRYLAYGAAADIWKISEVMLPPAPGQESRSSRINFVHKVLRVGFLSRELALISAKHNSLWQDVVKDYRSKVGQWKTLKHDNVIQVMGMADGMNLKVEFCENGCVREYLKAKPRSYSQKITIIAGVLKGLDYLHSQDPPVVHGSLNAGKVFINANGSAKIGEFGLASLCYPIAPFVPAVSFTDLSRWFSPEILGDRTNEGVVAPTRASDIWALGCVLFEASIIAERIPYSNLKHDVQIRRSILAGMAPGQTNRYFEGEPYHDFWALLTSCWEIHPERRPSAQDVRQQGNSVIEASNSRLPR